MVVVARAGKLDVMLAASNLADIEGTMPLPAHILEPNLHMHRRQKASQALDEQQLVLRCAYAIKKLDICSLTDMSRCSQETGLSK